MPSTQVTLVANTVAVVNLDALTGRIVVSVEAGTAAEVYATADGTNPIIPGGGEVTGSQIMISALGGVMQGVLQPPLQTAPGPAGPAGRTIPQVRLLSAGTPTVSVAW